MPGPGLAEVFKWSMTKVGFFLVMVLYSCLLYTSDAADE